MRPRKRVLLLVDLSYQIYRASAAYPMLSSNGVFTGGLYGFFVSFAKAVRETQATHVVCCRDVKPYKRSLVYPQYKQLRKKNIDEDLKDRYEQSTPLVWKTLEAIGIDPWGVAGFESDDLIAYTALRQRHRFDQIIAASNDSDLWQLFDAVPNFAAFNKEIEELWNAKRLREEHGLTAEQFMLSTALMGTHNDIEGIPKVGEKTSRAAVKDPAKLRKYMDSHGDLIRRNLDLIKLPHAEFRGHTPPALRESSPRDMYRALGRYDIEVTSSMVDALNQLQANR